MNEPNLKYEVADAFREVAAALQRAVDEGEQSRQSDADDLCEAFLAVVDRLEGAGEP